MQEIPSDPAPAAPLALSGPVLVFGGPYSNLEATLAVRRLAEDRAIAPENIVCTGDVVAYCADALETVRVLRRWGIHLVMGNCEESLGLSREDCGCGFAPGTACDLLSVAWYAHADRVLDDGSRAWMRSLPRRIDAVLNGRRLTFLHGALAQISQFVFASTALSDKRADLAAAGADAIIGGHCGLPFTQLIDGRLWHNAGAIGMPANDGTPRCWVSLLTPKGPDIVIEHLALDYDHAAAAAKMHRAGLPAGYADALSSGLWPSCDVLPPAELQRRGRPITPGAVRWRAAGAPIGLASSWPEGAAA